MGVTRTQFFLQMHFPDMNELISLAGSAHKDRMGRRLRGTGYSDMKKKCQAEAVLLIRDYYRKQGLPLPSISPDEAVQIHFDWYEADRRRDPDNLSGAARKIVLDSCRAIGLIPHDGWRLYREGSLALSDAFHVTHRLQEKTGVLVTITLTPRERMPYEEVAG